MASLLTRAEAERIVKEWQNAIAKMTDPSHRVCGACQSLYIEAPRLREICYCDWESDRYYD
jgi:hypothetical protein